MRVLHAGTSQLGGFPADAEWIDVLTLEGPPPTGSGSIVLVLEDALVASGWLARHAEVLFAEGERAVVRLEGVPAALIPAHVPIFSPESWTRGLDEREGNRPEKPDYTGEAAPWEQLAAQVRLGAEVQGARRALDLPASIQPGSILGAHSRLMVMGRPESSATFWKAEDLRHGPAWLAIANTHRAHSWDPVEPALHAWETLEHPRITTLFERGRHAGSPFATWARAPYTLASAIQSGALEPDQVLDVILDVGEGLTYGHGLGLVHGGLSPGWIEIFANHACVSGFGLAGLSRGSQDHLLFAAPELLAPDAVPTLAGDVYSFAMLVLLGLHGETLPYWVLRDASRLIDALHLQPELQRALAAGLDWDPTARPTTIEPLVDALLLDPTRVERLAHLALERGNLNRARLLVPRVPGSPDLRFALARRQAAADPEEGATELLRTLAASADEPASVWLEIAQLHHHRGQATPAIQAAERAWETHSSREEAVAALQILTAHEGTASRWTERLQGYDAQLPDDTLLALSRRSLAECDSERALVWLDRVDPEGSLSGAFDDLQHLLQAEVVTWRQRLDRAMLAPLENLDILEQVEAASPDPSLRRRLLDLMPPTLERLRRRAQLSRGRDPLPDLRAVAAHPDATARDHAALGAALYSVLAVDDAQQSAKRALGLDPHHLGALAIAAACAHIQGDLAEAAAHEALLLELRSPPDAEELRARVRIGHLLRWSEHPDEARAAYQRALALDPADSEAWWGLYVLRRNAPEPSDLPLPQGPHEATARLLAGVLHAPAVREQLASRPLAGLLAPPPGAPPWRVAAAVVDAALFEQRRIDVADLAERFPDWARPVELIQGWATATGPVPAWTDDGPELPVTIERPPLATPWIQGPRYPLAAMLAESPDPPFPPDDHTEEAPERPLYLVVGVGVEQESVALQGSMAVSPTQARALPGMLSVYRHEDVIYFGVDDGILKREGTYARELRVRIGDRLTWRGTALHLTDVAPAPAPEIDLLPFDELQDDTEPRAFPTVLQVHPVAEDQLDPYAPALLWTNDGITEGIQLIKLPLHVFTDENNNPAFTWSPVKAASSIVAGDHGPVLVSRQGDRLPLMDRAIFSLEGQSVRYRAPSTQEHAEGPTIEMPKPSPPIRPWLVREGSPKRAYRVIEAPFRMGRAKECEVQIRTDAMLSRVHCKLEIFDGYWFVVDGGSSNGTFLNGQRLTRPGRLRESDTITLGSTRFTFTRFEPTELEEPTDEADLLELDDDDEQVTRDFSTAEVDEARRRSAASALTEGEAAQMVTVANKALGVLYRALDKIHGVGKGASELQLLLASRPRDSLLADLVVSGPMLPHEQIINRLTHREEQERRTRLERDLLDLVHRATESTCELLPDTHVEEVLALLAAVEHRRRLQL